jgi:polyferredoxin
MSWSRRQGNRQRVRKAVIFAVFLSFPVTMNFLSPYVIIDAAMQGIINGSFIVFGLLLASALVVGRLWCAWVCPAAGFQEVCFVMNDRRTGGGRREWIKWGIWFPWLGVIVAMAISAGGYQRVDLLHLTETGVSVDEPFKYVTYYLVLGVFLVLALLVGRRAGCHYICWMAPFMIVGRKIRNVVGWPSLRLIADSGRCIECRRCTRSCPMSLDVDGMVQREQMENAECILCGTCIDGCPEEVIRYSFSAGR